LFNNDTNARFNCGGSGVDGFEENAVGWVEVNELSKMTRLFKPHDLFPLFLLDMDWWKVEW
jgi:hypothetical protein